MTKDKIIAWFFVILWAIVLILTFMNKMMPAMDLMAIGDVSGCNRLFN